MKTALWYLVIVVAFTYVVALIASVYLVAMWACVACLLLGHVSGMVALSILKGRRGQKDFRDWDRGLYEPQGRRGR
ncbi:MAG TPA: hypothetical protein VMY98_07305 [Anaerolineae bacterium]|nr:hypothetical protein [Anaerolineae bacterium]